MPEEEVDDNEELTRILNERWGQTGEDAATQPSGETQETPSEEVAPPPTVETPEAPTTLTLPDGSELPLEAAQRYVGLDKYFEENPQVVHLLRGIADGSLTVSPVGQPAESATTEGKRTPETVALPEDIDPEDPGIKFLLGRLAEADQRYEQVVGRLDSIEPQLQQQTANNAQAIVHRAARSFQSDRGLTDEQMAKVQEHAASMQVLPALMSPVDPVTNLPRQVDPLAAVEQALDMAYWQVPEFREAEIQRQLTQKKEDDTRKAKLGALSGNSGSVPRTKPEPKTPEEMRQAMIEELAPNFTP